jgi:hypothetical protein
LIVRIYICFIELILIICVIVYFSLLFVLISIFIISKNPKIFCFTNYRIKFNLISSISIYYRFPKSFVLSFTIPKISIFTIIFIIIFDWYGQWVATAILILWLNSNENQINKYERYLWLDINIRFLVANQNGSIYKHLLVIVLFLIYRLIFCWVWIWYLWVDSWLIQYDCIIYMMQSVWFSKFEVLTMLAKLNAFYKIVK